MNELLRRLPARATFKRAQRGLYGGKHIRFGNKVSHSERKTRRSWKPNVQRAFLWSDILRRRVSVRVTTSALRTVTKYGGLDSYLLNAPDHIVQSEWAVSMREKLKRKMAQQKREGEAIRWFDELPPISAQDALDAALASPAGNTLFKMEGEKVELLMPLDVARGEAARSASEDR